MTRHVLFSCICTQFCFPVLLVSMVRFISCPLIHYVMHSQDVVWDMGANERRTQCLGLWRVNCHPRRKEWKHVLDTEKLKMVEAFRGSKVSNYSYSEPRQFKFWMGASSREQSCGLTQPLAMRRGSWWITIVRQYFGAGKGPFQFLKGFLVRKIHCSCQGSHVCFPKHQEDQYLLSVFLSVHALGQAEVDWKSQLWKIRQNLWLVLI